MCCCQSPQIKSYHSHPMLSVLAKSKLLSLIYKVLTTNRRICITSSHFSLLSVFIFGHSRPSIYITLSTNNNSFQYASPRLWNQLASSLHQPCTNLSSSDSPSPKGGISPIGSIDSPHSSSITSPLSHSRLQTFFCKSFSP